MHKQGRREQNPLGNVYLSLVFLGEMKEKAFALTCWRGILASPFSLSGCKAFSSVQPHRSRTFSSIAWILGKSSLSSCCYHGRQIFFLIVCLMVIYPPVGISISETERGQGLSRGCKATGEGRRGNLREYCMLQEHLESLGLG